MKKRNLSIIAALALSTSLYAGGDITPAVEPVIPIIEETAPVNDSAFYVGLGLSLMSLEDDYTKEEFSAKGVTLQAGYQYNEYLALEGRFTRDVGDVDYDHGSIANGGLNIDDYPTDFSNIGLYIKPMYTVDDFTAYALLGYGEVELTNIPQGDEDRTEAGFQWGLGASYLVFDNISIFIDYLRMYDDKGFDGRATNRDVLVDAWTLGVTYKF